MSNPVMKKIEEGLREILAIARGEIEPASRRIHRTFRTHWLPEDREYVGLCDQYPGLSWIAATEAEAMRGIMVLVAETEAEITDGGKNAST